MSVDSLHPLQTTAKRGSSETVPRSASARSK